MSANYIAQPDLGFIAEIRGLGGETLKNVTNALLVPWPAPLRLKTALFPEKR